MSNLSPMVCALALAVFPVGCLCVSGRGWQRLAAASVAGIEETLVETHAEARTMPLAQSDLEQSDVKEEATKFIDELRELMAGLPRNCALKHPAGLPKALAPEVRKALQLPSPKVDSFKHFMDQVLTYGLPFQTAARGFSLEQYGLPDKINGTDVSIKATTVFPTFFSNYAPPDNLDGQVIDLVATGNGRWDITPSELPSPLQREIGTYAEIRKWMKTIGDFTTTRALGPIPRAPGSSVGKTIELDVGGVRVRKEAHQKVVLSDHIPISFDVNIPQSSVEASSGSEGHTFSALSMNMLAYDFIKFNFWNTEPADGTKHAWNIAKRIRAVMDEKTKWMPEGYAVYLSGGYGKYKDENGTTHEDEQYRQWNTKIGEFWKWIAKVESEGFKKRAASNPFARSDVRLAMLAELLMMTPPEERPDFLFLQEVGLNEVDGWAKIDEAGGGFEAAVAEKYPALEKLLQAYQVANASPNMGRSRSAPGRDSGLILVKTSVLGRYKVKPLTHAGREAPEEEREAEAEYKKLYAENKFKPIVGVRVATRDGKALANLFGAHFEKTKTVEHLKTLFRLSPGVPTMVVGDFNGVLKPADRVVREDPKEELTDEEVSEEEPDLKQTLSAPARVAVDWDGASGRRLLAKASA